MTRPRYLCVGSGTCVPSVTRGPACHLLEAGELRMLLDVGSGSLRSLARLGEPFETVSAVGLTHRHMDHVADLLPLLFALRNTPGLRRRERLDLFGYSGLAADLESLAAVFGPWVLEPGFEVAVRELAPGSALDVERGGVRAHVTAHSVRHSPEAIGFRIELFAEDVSRRPACTFAYSGDSGATGTLVGLAADADLFVCECAFPDDQAVEGHLTPSELLPICASAGARRTIATHFYPVWDERGVERVWSEQLARFGREIPLTAAHDGLEIQLTGEGTC